MTRLHSHCGSPWTRITLLISTADAWNPLQARHNESPALQTRARLEDKAMLTWSLQLAPKESRKLGFTYSVKHPKEQKVVLE